MNTNATGFCSICGNALGTEHIESWPWGQPDGEVHTIVVHSDCWRLFDLRGIGEWFEDGGSKWTDLIYDLSFEELEAEIAACLDLECALRLREMLVEMQELADEDEVIPGPAQELVLHGPQVGDFVAFAFRTSCNYGITVAVIRELTASRDRAELWDFDPSAYGKDNPSMASWSIKSLFGLIRSWPRCYDPRIGEPVDSAAYGWWKAVATERRRKLKVVDLEDYETGTYTWTEEEEISRAEAEGEEHPYGGTYPPRRG